MTRGRLMLAVALVAPALALPAPPASGAPGASAGESTEMIGVINRVRAKHGLHHLRPSGSLIRSSHRYARRMLVRDYFGHSSRILASGRFGRLGEALAYHWRWKPRIRRTVRRWMGSSSHRALVLSRGFRYIGASRAKGRYGRKRASVWVLHIGR